MRKLTLILLMLLTASPASYAADWLTWPAVGSATFTWGPFTLYSAQVLTPDGRYNSADQDLALVITYQREIDSEQLVEATRDQWQAQGIDPQEPQTRAWLAGLQNLWPDVTPGSQLAFVFRHQQGQFWYRASASQPGFTPLGTSHSLSFSRAFLAIWLGPKTTWPGLRNQLTGEQK